MFQAWSHLYSSASALWKSQGYSTNEQNTFPLFPSARNSLSRRDEWIRELLSRYLTVLQSVNYSDVSLHSVASHRWTFTGLGLQGPVPFLHAELRRLPAVT